MKTLTLLQVLAVATLAVCSAPSGAQVLKVESDLIIQPSADWNQGSAQIDVAPKVQMSDMTFSGPPYAAKWSNIQASVMDGLMIKTQQQAGGVVAVDITWDHPGILIFNMDMAFGRCFGVNWRLPQGGWKAEGRMVYDFAKKAPVWIDFSFLNNATGAATLNLGDCSFAGDNLNLVNDHLLSQAQNPEWMRGLVQETVLKWAAVNFASGKNKLLDPIKIQLTDCTTMTWKPAGIMDLANGRWRVPGTLEFDTSDALPKYDFGTVRRTEAEAVLNSLTTSQFVLPLNAMEQITAALARNRGFFSRTMANSISSFLSLVGNRKNQNMEWTDLKFMPLYPELAFDVTVYGPVTLGDRKAVAGKGLDFSAKTSLNIQSKVFELNNWQPYFDFRSVETGRTKVDVYDGSIHIKMSFDALHTRGYLRDEFAQVRTADDFTNPDLLNARFSKFFEGKYFHADLPKWRVGELELVGSALNMSAKSLRVPLTLRPVK